MQNKKMMSKTKKKNTAKYLKSQLFRKKAEF